MPWYVWVILAVAAVIGEALTLSLVLGSVALAAFLAAALSTVSPLPVQVAAFCVVALVLIVAVRPLALKVLPRSAGVEALPSVGPTGRNAVAQETIDVRGGQIRVGRGEFWSARVEAPNLTIPAGQPVDVVRMEGLVALVRPVLEATVSTPVPSSVASFSTLADTRFGLSAREVEVLRLMTAGLSNQEIADRLVLSPRTVHHHVSHIFSKMGVDSRVDAVRLAWQQGIASAESTDET